MKILLLTAYFPPEVGSAPHLFYELGSELVRRGHRVTVLTGFPAYNIDEQTLPEKYRFGARLIEEVEGMHVMRIRSPRMPRHIRILRGFEQVAMAATFALGGLILPDSDHDVVLLYSPPLFLGLSALLIRFLKKSRVVVNIQDLFPQSAIDLGVLRSRPLIWLFRKIESLIYRRSNLITVHSTGNRDHVVRCGGRKEATFEVPNLVDTDKIVPGDRLSAFRTKYRIPASEFVVSFAGVIGLSQDLDTVIDAAKLTREQSVVYYIVGDGIEKARLVKKAEGVPNVRFLPMLPKDEYVELLHASDLCLVTLHKEVKTPVVPSKILSIMAAGRPILASMPLSGDAPALVQTAGCGICIPPENPADMAGAVTRFVECRDENDRMGKSGRNYVVSHCSLRACASHYEQLFASILPNK